WLTAERIRLACRLIERGERGAERIAHLSGLGTGANLRIQMRRRTGLTPTGYRARFGPARQSAPEPSGRGASRVQVRARGEVPSDGSARGGRGGGGRGGGRGGAGVSVGGGVAGSTGSHGRGRRREGRGRACLPGAGCRGAGVQAGGDGAGRDGGGHACR